MTEDADSIVEVTEEEGVALFDKACHDRLGVSAEEFLAAHDSGAYPAGWRHGAICQLEMLIPFGRRGNTR